jgi:hypothetical protein
MNMIDPGVSGDADELWPTRKVLARYSICDKTLDRWLTEYPALNFPRPMMINKRRYWRQRDLHAWEIARASTP